MDVGLLDLDAGCIGAGVGSFLDCHCHNSEDGEELLYLPIVLWMMEEMAG
jgi:hypothetical protein